MFKRKKFFTSQEVGYLVEVDSRVEFLKIFGKNCVQWPVSGAAGAENFDRFWYFSEKSPNFVKVEAFIA